MVDQDPYHEPPNSRGSWSGLRYRAVCLGRLRSRLSRAVEVCIERIDVSGTGLVTHSHGWIAEHQAGEGGNRGWGLRGQSRGLFEPLTCKTHRTVGGDW